MVKFSGRVLDKKTIPKGNIQHLPRIRHNVEKGSWEKREVGNF